MRITVDIDENDLGRLQKLTGKKKKATAIQAALEEYLRMQRVEDIVRAVREGRVDYGTTNEEIEASWHDAR
jgi:hypothetical protein